MITFLININKVNSEIDKIYYPQNTNINITGMCFNNNTYCSPSGICNITILYSNDSILILNKKMINSNGIFSYLLNSTQTSQKGIYKEYIICSDGSSNGYSANQFYITGNGNPPASPSLFIFIWLIFILSSVGLIWSVFWNLSKFVTLDENIYGILISWGIASFNFVALILAQNYLLDTFIEEWVSKLLNALMWSAFILPLIAYFVTIMYNYFQQKKEDIFNNKR